LFSLFPAFSAVYLKVVYIADHSVDCGTQKCLLSRDAPTDTYHIFDKTIEGFSYEDGYEYCILMEIRTPSASTPLAPFDSSQIKYVLSEIKSKTKTKTEGTVTVKQTSIAIPDSSKWLLYKLRLKDETKTFSIQKAYLQFDIKNNTVSGSSDCNSLNANFTADSTAFKFENIVTTKMACGKRSIETVFLNALNSTTKIKFTSKLLYLFKGKTMVALFTRKK
jgi:heat shock protein HslJ